MKDSEFIFSLELLANDSSAVNSKLIKAMFFFVLLRNPALNFSAVTLKKILGIVGSCRARHFLRGVPIFSEDSYFLCSAQGLSQSAYKSGPCRDVHIRVAQNKGVSSKIKTTQNPFRR